MSTRTLCQTLPRHIYMSLWRNAEMSRRVKVLEYLSKRKQIGHYGNKKEQSDPRVPNPWKWSSSSSNPVAVSPVKSHDASKAWGLNKTDNTCSSNCKSLSGHSVETSGRQPEGDFEAFSEGITNQHVQNNETKIKC